MINNGPDTIKEKVTRAKDRRKGPGTKMTDKEFVEQLHLSFMWWKNKAMARL